MGHLGAGPLRAPLGFPRLSVSAGGFHYILVEELALRRCTDTKSDSLTWRRKLSKQPSCLCPQDVCGLLADQV